ncbi:hypothetical protein J1N35_029570 [Gossypium stocksii]|uniref:Pectinesterase catalytic domain-containing protein n=1 Tax=Gossypium stocksii TaxID=47602 RepID=A0A9D3ZT72_9ROSI|nr:hypothetical protein J1N35_029570 [Gossypium stocksii]
MHVFHMCSNALAMIKNLMDTDMVSQGYHPSSRRQFEEQDQIEWPKWLSAGDRRLLQATTVIPNVTVAADGNGDFFMVSEAVAAAPERSTTRYIIKIKAEVYRENVDVSRKKTNLMFVGDGKVNTIITASRNVVDGSTTFHSATVDVVDMPEGRPMSPGTLALMCDEQDTTFTTAASLNGIMDDGYSIVAAVAETTVAAYKETGERRRRYRGVRQRP